MYDRVVTINNTHWPAYRKPGATLVDLRMFDPNDRSPKPRLVFRPEKLRELGIPDALIEAAAKSDPQGFLLFDDLPNQTEPATGHANQPTTEHSTSPGQRGESLSDSDSPSAKPSLKLSNFPIQKWQFADTRSGTCLRILTSSWANLHARHV